MRRILGPSPMLRRAAARRVVVVAVVAGVTAAPAHAQLPDASATSLARGGTSVAVARGFASVFANPAGLGMSGTPRFSLAVLPLGVRAGLGPVTLGDLDDVEGRLVAPETKERWLARILASGGQDGGAGVEVSLASMSAGRVGFQLSSLASGAVRVSPGVAEAVLFGNAGRTGVPAELDVAGSEVQGFAVTTAAVSYGFPVALTRGEMAVGATLTASLGHAVVRGQGSSGRVESDPVRVDVRLPVIMTSDDDAGDGGTGVGLDIGVAFRRDRLFLGATVRNLVNTFERDATSLVFREGTAVFERGSGETDFDARPVEEAPEALRRSVEDFGFRPTLAVGAAWDVDRDLRVMGELRNRFGDGMGSGPAFHAGVGAEYRVAPPLYVRAGAAAVTDGAQLGGGLSLVLGPVHLTLSGARRTGPLRDATLGRFTLSFGAH